MKTVFLIINNTVAVLLLILLAVGAVMAFWPDEPSPGAVKMRELGEVSKELSFNAPHFYDLIVKNIKLRISTPATAVFPSWHTWNYFPLESKPGQYPLFSVHGYFDAANAYGTLVRNRVTAAVELESYGTFRIITLNIQPQ